MTIGLIYEITFCCFLECIYEVIRDIYHQRIKQTLHDLSLNKGI